MADYQTLKLNPQFKIIVMPETQGFILSDFEKNRIEHIWTEEQARSFSGLYNGLILNFLRLEGETLYGEFIDYKFYLAQVREPTLAAVLKIKPVAVSGITRTAEKILVGQRTTHVTLYPNFYELVPSGGIDPEALVGAHIELTKQFEKELWEETGISVTEIKEIRPFALIQAEGSYEICASITVNYLMSKEDLRPNTEYQKLLWLSRSDIPIFLQKHAGAIVPLSEHLLTHPQLYTH